MIVSAAQGHELILGVLTGRGAQPDTEDLQARWLVEADLRGQDSHGTGWGSPARCGAPHRRSDQAQRPSATAGKGILRTDCKAERNSW